MADLLGDGSPWTTEQLVDGILSRGLDLGATPTAAVDDVLFGEDISMLMPLLDGRHVLLSASLLGRSFTHRVTAAEIDGGYLAVSPDLEPISILTEEPTHRQLVDGTPLADLIPELDAEQVSERGLDPAELPDVIWLLEPNSLSRLNLSPDDLIAVTVREDGFELAARPAAPTTAGALGSQASTTIDWHMPSAPMSLSSLIWQMCADEPEAFTELQPPLADMVDEVGLALQGELVAPAGFDFESWRTDARLANLRDTHDLDEDEALAVLVLTDVYRQMRDVFEYARQDGASDEVLDELFAGSMDDDPGPDVDLDPSPDDQQQLVRAMLDLLHLPAVAETLKIETIGADRAAAAGLGLFAETLEATAPRSARPNLRWLRGTALERLGNVLEAEQAYEDALTLDPSCELALLDLAQIASDRGNAERGLSLLRRAGVREDDDLVAMLEHFRPVERTDRGRNDPCWCGSGRKYKLCHRGRESLPLAERAAWLYQKAAAHLADGPWRTLVLDLAEICSSDWHAADALWQAVNDPLVGDVAMFEGGAFEEFLHERGVLLPDDEALLAQQWLLVDRSVHEVESVSPGTGFTARDIRTGQRVDVQERTASRTLKSGVLLCARLVPAGETVQCFGGIEIIARHQRDALIELLDSDPDPHDVVAFLSARYAPPTLQTTDGDPLLFCETKLESDDPAALRAHLDAHYERVGGLNRWHDLEAGDAARRILATLSLDGTELVVETTSESRMNRTLATLLEVVTGLEVVAREQRTIDDLGEAATQAPREALDPRDPEIAAALEQFVLQHEQAWLDESIPALSGATPREAADDPTRRPDLERLLDTFPAPEPGDVGMMDPARLRDALGL
ncbi:SEC-C metal-binding domain-containing protein [Aeromicrobium sp. Sec7.5]|uniref:SEC-C metal-binding domain-containing protein n=1 Tax=Aeromicrobium sp. Sec7.5 TaxID=3121276 RepID=UPI002FE47DFD